MFELIDIGTLRGLGTALVLLAFTAVTLWAYSGKRRDAFAEAANLPFADEPKPAVSRIQA
ncbi:MULTISPECIES: CcoQ/FixQ family Cbb3-type cytochrome c oxidase assembly chaperone [Pseudomonadaceae]|jgi:cytochrome c oxidase cbb3-type subunit 4|uniref:Cbb3-type cytochrome oxidase component n=2 Tax=Ectopseudomonas TaxID=3236654 RepID=A4XVJ1_ECTM1|nr:MULTISPECIES: CcoQ/FixQ family Cbb3-type cytochrome c oxidase assembly chaperone [Pseudomonas]ATH82529.1 CcoQ/FixQ family Cbb3-type cytochrome c oxidase assembly chaperone [Pseudomonas mendocina]MBA4245484.1 CcoQ/FixQ family Cbb3-type cytochrome c oxidase assembly chaperone [Pseudomonas sp.]MBF8160598.1 CcoQ/FixQ family Cbb3-type cytochrome c oxidase assembly chaperone [Pseudomonas mendocina]MDH0096010.1 CcoQ/FixQ family Cbb3-type cytochrome c oxidase assembly chaperone [Pseudomonas sp. GD04